MSLKLKVLGLGLLAVMATSAFAVMNASAGVGGHFVHEGPTNHATVIGSESPTHLLHFVKEGGSDAERIGCTKDAYHGTVSAKTVQTVTITPNWSECETTNQVQNWDVHENGCSITFASGKAGQTHHTAQVVCPVNSPGFVITHPNCTITVPPQTVGGGGHKGGITYTTTVENNKHALTVNVTVKTITSHYHGGICIFLGTPHFSEMKGSVTVKAEDTAKNQVSITETTG